MGGGEPGEFFVSYFEMLSPLMSHFSFQDCSTVCQLGGEFMAHRGFFHDTQWTMSTVCVLI